MPPIDAAKHEKPPKGIAAPKNLNEGTSRLSRVRDDMKQIEYQLASPNVTDKDTGERLSYAEWGKWRAMAINALRWKALEHGYLKRWVQTHRLIVEARRVSISDISDPIGYLGAAVGIIDQICMEEDIDPDTRRNARTLIDVIEKYFRNAAA